MDKLKDPSVQKAVLTLSFALGILNAFLNLKANINELEDRGGRGSVKRTGLLVFNLVNTASRFRKIDKQD